MSQRKEKYIRRALEGAELGETALHETRASAAAIHHRVDGVVRDVQQVRDDQVRLAKHVRRQRHQGNEEADAALAFAIAAMVVAAIAVILSIVSLGVSAVRKAETQRAAEAAKAAQAIVPAVNLIYEEPAVIVEGEDPHELEKIIEALLDQGYLSDAVPLSYEEQDFLHTACEETGVPYTLALAVIQKETNFRNGVAGDGGTSLGYMQVRPSCHWDRMERLGVTDLEDPYSNFRVGCDYLAECLEKTDTVAMALMAYNAGYTGASKMWKEGIYETKYAKAVLEYAESWEQTLGG